MYSFLSSSLVDACVCVCVYVCVYVYVCVRVREGLTRVGERLYILSSLLRWSMHVCVCVSECVCK